MRGFISLAKNLVRRMRHPREPAGPVSVATVCAGRDVCITEVNMCACGCMNVRRLGEMGIYPGAQLRVASGGGGAQIVLQIDDSHIALDSHQACEITVLPLNNGARVPVRTPKCD